MKTTEIDYPKVHRLVDQLVDTVKTQITRDGYAIACKGSGCRDCCSEPVYVDSIEMDYLIFRLSPAQLSDLTVYLDDWVKWATTSGFLAEENIQVVHQPHFRSMCPFIGEKGECSIYEFRPMACRMHLALGSSKWCKPENTTGTLTVSYPSEVLATVLVPNYREHLATMYSDHMRVILAEKILGIEIQSVKRIDMQSVLGETQELP